MGGVYLKALDAGHLGSCLFSSRGGGKNEERKTRKINTYGFTLRTTVKCARNAKRTIPTFPPTVRLQKCKWL